MCLYTEKHNADTKSDMHILVLEENRKKKLVFKDLALWGLGSAVVPAIASVWHMLCILTQIGS